MRVNLKEANKTEFMQLCSGLKTEKEDIRSDSDLSNAYDHFYETGLSIYTTKKGNKENMILNLFYFIWKCSQNFTEKHKLIEQKDFVNLKKLMAKERQ